MYRGVLLMKKNKGPLSARAAWRAKAARGTKRDKERRPCGGILNCRRKSDVGSLLGIFVETVSV